jgi:two-component system chemotaxis sensor kinase CheA
MDDLLREFVTETNESLDVVDVELVRFEQDPNNAKILDNIFRLVHTIKGTCGFLGLPRLEALAHAAETLMGKFRDGAPASSEAVTLILATIDRIKIILESLESDQREPEGADGDLITSLEGMVDRISVGGAKPESEHSVGTLVHQVLERPLREGEDTLDDLERVFRNTAIEAEPAKSPKPAASAVDAAVKEDETGKSANQSIRVTVDTLERLMTMVSELVLTRNQLLEIGAVTRNRNSKRRCNGCRTSPPNCRKA